MRLMKSLARLTALIGALALPVAACAQGAVQQSGAITAYHAPYWFSNGVVGDGGYPTKPFLNALGLFNGSNCPLGVSSQTGPGVSTSPYSLFTLCQTNTTSTLTFAGVNGQANPAVYFNIGGVNYGFPGPGNGDVDGPASAVNGNLACFNTTSGKLIKDCGVGFPIPQANGGTGTTSIASLITGSTVATAPLSGTELLLGTQSAAQRKITTASIAALAVASPYLAINVATYGAVGNSSAAADTIGFTNAIAAACATATASGGVVEVDVPVPPVGYTITTPLALCKNLHIRGIGGYPTITYTGTGTMGTPTSLFVNSGKQSVEIDHLDLEGAGNGYVYAYRAVTNATSAINVRIHDIIALSGWGDGTTGGLFSIESDSGANAFYNNYVSAQTAVFSITAPTDRLDIYDNLLASSNGTCIIGASPSSGAATVRVDHNIFECEGGGAMNLNTLGEWIVKDNEEETLNAITNADSAIYDFVSVTLMQFDGNTSNSHGMANYDVYVHDAVTNSVFSNLSAVSAATSAYKVGAGLGNVYLYNNSGNGPSHVYDIDYAGIVTNQLYGGEGVAHGCGTTTTGIIPNTFCRAIEEISPGTSTTANALFLTPALGSSHEAAIVVGQDFSTGNSAEFGSTWFGNNNASNRAVFGLANGNPLSISVGGNVSTNGSITGVAGLTTSGTVTGAGFTAGVSAGVSCPANTVVLMTLVVTDGIVTHC